MRIACLAVLLAACGPDDTTGPCKDSLLAGDLVITEVFADYAAPTGGTGTDDGKEWLEIYNNSDRALSLKGLTVVHSRPDGGEAKTHAMDDVTIAPGQFFTLGNSTSDLVPAYVDYGYSADLGDLYNTNGGKLALRCGDSEIDAAQYELVKSGRSRQLSNLAPPDYTTNDDLATWCESKDTEFEPNNYGTPGQDNDCAPVVAGACSDGGTMRPVVTPGPGELVITEVMPSPSKVSDTSGEWFEAKALASFDLNGLGVDRAGDSSAPSMIDAAACLRVDAGDYVVFAKSTDPTMNGGIAGAVASFGFSMVAGSTTSIGDVQIVAASTVIDAVSWQKSTAGKAFQLDPDLESATANDDATSFCDAVATYGLGDLGTPGMANAQCATLPPAGMCNENGVPRPIVTPPVGPLVITEFLANAAGTGTDPTQEWFEVTNVGSASFDLNGLTLKGTTTSNVIQSANCKPLAPGAYAVFAHSPEADQNGGLPVVDGTFTFALGSKIEVLDEGTVLDAVAFGSTPDGVALQLNPASTTATANDDLMNFCRATDAQRYNAQIANYGTPKAANACL